MLSSVAGATSNQSIENRFYLYLNRKPFRTLMIQNPDYYAKGFCG